MSGRNSLLAFLLGLAIAMPSRAASGSGQTVHTQFKGLAADAEFDTLDPSGCIETMVTLIAVNGSIKQDGGPVASSGGLIFISQANNCTQTQLILADGGVPFSLGALNIDSSLKSATLKATVNVTDLVSNTSLAVAISLTWTGSGQLANFEDHSNFRQPAFGLKSTMRDSGTFRPATATGSITLKDEDLISGASTGAELSSAKQGEVDISH